MGNQKIEVVINSTDIKAVERLMREALAQLIDEKINRLPIEYRKKVCEEILKVSKIDALKDTE